MPEGLWKIYEPDKAELALDYRINNADVQPWWSFQPLQHLDLSSNCLTDIPNNIKMFQELLVLNVSKQQISLSLLSNHVI